MPSARLSQRVNYAVLGGYFNTPSTSFTQLQAKFLTRDGG